ncbi:MAG: hypothetical protein K0R68_56 [Mycobacterium sp.]|nr:hypothetical protein [Mycobacterium sp.]
MPAQYPDAYPYPPALPHHPQTAGRTRLVSAATAIVLVVALAVIGVAIASPEAVRSAFAPNPVSTLPGGGTTAASSTKKTSGSPTSGPWIPQPSTTGKTTSRTTRTTTTRTTTSTPRVPTGEAALAGNPLLRVGGMAKQACSPPGWPSDAAAAQGFNDVAVRCLASAWTPLLDRAGMQYTPPLVFAPSGTFNTPCGSGDYALYCSSNNGIYLPLGIINRDWDGFPFVHLAMVSHEFGHHVQELSGSLGEAWSQRRKVGTNSPAGLEWSRRMELQAECFSGLFLGSVVDSGGPFTQSDLSDVIQAYIGDETHGTSANGDAWLMRGSENQIARCNTWVASSAEVA